MNGYQVLIDVTGVSRQRCVDDGMIAGVLMKIARAVGAEVVAMNRYRFAPPAAAGCTVVLTLDASHLSVHTYAESGQMAIDAFISGDRNKALRCAEEIKVELVSGASVVREEILERFTSARHAETRDELQPAFCG